MSGHLSMQRGQRLASPATPPAVGPTTAPPARTSGQPQASPNEPTTAPAAWREDVRSVCEEAEWTVHDGAEPSLAIDFDGDVFHVSPTAAGALTVAATVCRLGDVSSNSSTAIERYLHRVNAMLREVRVASDPTGEATAGGSTIVAQASTSLPPTQEKLERALTACSTAQRFTRDQIAALEVDSCADAFLAIQGEPTTGRNEGSTDVTNPEG